LPGRAADLGLAEGALFGISCGRVTRRAHIIALVVALWASPPQRTAEQFVLADGFQMDLWAESPMFFNPTNIDVDVQGRLWVAEAVNYRDFNTAKQQPLTHQAGDRILILTDANHDGRAESAKVFVQDQDLRAPLGLAVIGNRVVVSASPHLIVYTDVNGDDKPDKKELLLTGFGGFDHDHGLHALVAGPDGRWYFNTGNAGPHTVTDRSGFTLRAGSLYTGGTPYNLKNQGGMVSDDGRVWTGGLALRMEPDGTRLTVLAHNFRNAYELAIDSFGDLWQNDNDDQVMACRTTWLMEGANAGYFSADGARYWQADRRPGQTTFTAHWHQDDPGVLPAGDNTGAGAPAGIVRYEGDAFGPRYRGLLLSADAGRNAIFGYLPQARGAGFSLERFDAVSSLAVPNENYIWHKVEQDRRKWFRPSDVAIGTDGAIYVADWYDPIVGGHQMQDGKGYGRIYRITPKGRTLTTPSIDLATTAGQSQALLSPATNVRNAGFERLKAAGVAALPVVRKILSDANPYHRARAIWLLAALGGDGVREVEGLLAHADADVRITAYRALRRVKASIHVEARRLADDPSPAVRREVALSLRGMPFDQSRDILLTLATRYDGVDRWYLEALGLAATRQEDAFYSALLLNHGTPDAVGWDAKLAALAWRLHPTLAIDALAARAASPGLRPDARQQAITALAFINHPKAAQAMANLTRSALPDAAAQAMWWMEFRKTNDWRGYPVEGWVATAPAPPRASLEAMLPLRTRVLDAEAPIDRRIDAAIAMAEDAEGGQLLVQLAAENKVAATLREAIGSVIFANPDRSVRAAAHGLFPRPGGPRSMTVSDVSLRVGDNARGEQRYNVAGCATCHRTGTTGADVGPDLTDIATKFDRPGLVEAIVNPNQAIAFGYGAEVFVTRRQEPHIGFLLADGPTVSIRDAYGRVLTIAREDLAARVPLKSSLMPDPLALALTEQDVADIAAYLMALKR
jgi:putative membrane-bound dehydrogenase-like protein